jgi:hypothetical protein
MGQWQQYRTGTDTNWTANTAVRDTCAAVNTAVSTLYTHDMVYMFITIMILKCTPCGYRNCGNYMQM